MTDTNRADFIELTMAAANLALSIAGTVYDSLEENIRSQVQKITDDKKVPEGKTDWSDPDKMSEYLDRINFSAYCVDNGILEVVNAALIVTHTALTNGSISLSPLGIITIKTDNFKKAYKEKAEVATPTPIIKMLASLGFIIKATVDVADAGVKAGTKIQSAVHKYDGLKVDEDKLREGL